MCFIDNYLSKSGRIIIRPYKIKTYYIFRVMSITTL